MATKAKLHWFWRGMIAAVVGLAVNGVCLAFLIHYGSIESMLNRFWRRIGVPDAVVLTLVVFAGIPAMIAAFGAYGLLTRRLGRLADGELHCRRCDHILRCLSEPRCPECGEAI
jgi:hypothetical protein